MVLYSDYVNIIQELNNPTPILSMDLRELTINMKNIAITEM